MHHRKLRAGEVAGTYQVTTAVTEAELLGIAKAFARRRLARGRKITHPTQAFEYLQVLLQDVEHEVFSALFLDAQHRVIRFEALFRGTIDGAAVYPREVVRQALEDNAAAVIFAHNHPSGVAEPSQADISLTRRLKEALGLVDIRVLDHMVIGHGEVISLAERGLM
mgnify:CR=1 FL=1